MSVVCHSYVIRMYSHVIRMCRMSFVCHPYVTRMSSVRTRISPLCTRMYSYVIRMSLVCTRVSFVCHSSVVLPWAVHLLHFIYHSPSHSPYLIAFILHRHSTLLSVSPFSQSRLIHIHHIWLHSYYIVIQPYCQFHLSANPVSGNWQPTSALDKVLILGRYSLLEAELQWFYYSLTLIWNKKYNRTFLYYFSIKFYLQEKYLLYIILVIKYILYNKIHQFYAK